VAILSPKTARNVKRAQEINNNYVGRGCRREQRGLVVCDHAGVEAGKNGSEGETRDERNREGEREREVRGGKETG
jgi:hypothetical protein